MVARNSDLLLPFIMKLLVGFIAFIFLFSSCETAKEIDIVKFEDVRIKKIEGKELDLEVDLSINNLNFYGVKLKEIKGELFVQNKLIGNIVLNDKVKIKRKSTNRYAIPFHIHLEEGVLIRFVQFSLQKHVDIQLKGFAKGTVYAIPRKEIFEFNKAIDGRFFNIKNILGK